MRLTICRLVTALAFMLPTSVAAGPPSDVSRIAALEAQVQGLLDREAVRALVMEYGRSVDDKDWVAHRAIYTDPLEVDYSSMPGAPGSSLVPLDKWIEQLRGFFEHATATQHITDVLKLDMTGERAHAVTMLHAQHYMPNTLGEPIQRMIGTYEMWFVRTADGWKISKVKPHLRWNEGNYWIFLKASGAPLPPGQ